MKTFLRLTAIVVCMCCMASCDDDAPVITTLDVTPANLHGAWKLAEWNNLTMPEGTYCYIVFNRKEATFEIYQKFDSMYARHITGSFSVKSDPYLGFVISGDYDYGNGKWNDRYIVTDLLESGSMTWTSVSSAEDDVQKFVRVEAVPSDIISEADNVQE